MNFIQKLMKDRVGVDHLSMFLLIVSIILQIILQILPWSGIVFLALIPTVIAIWRALSKNKLKRHQENILFLKYWYPIQSKIKNQSRGIKSKVKDRNQYRYFKCSSCKQKLRVPRKVKRAQITCPKCKHSSIQETFGNKVSRTFKK